MDLQIDKACSYRFRGVLSCHFLKFKPFLSTRSLCAPKSSFLAHKLNVINPSSHKFNIKRRLHGSGIGGLMGGDGDGSWNAVIGMDNIFVSLKDVWEVGLVDGRV
jgi:hypothetical protein